MMGLLFVGLIFTAGELSFALLMNMGLVVILLGLSLVDLDTMEIPNGYILFGILWWLGIVIANGVYQFLHVTESVDKQGVLKASAYYLLWHLLAGVIIAGMILILSLIMDRLLQKESMGGGDIKLLFMVSLYLGIYQGLFMLIMSCLIGLLVVVITKKDKIPFGPAIAAGTYLGLTIGIPITNWYIGLL
jgi:leader peptidase (prepilin peptidase)/N-methyltransferase